MQSTAELKKIEEKLFDNPVYLVAKETNAPIPLKSITLNLNIENSIASYEMIQQYENAESVPIESMFLFPLDSDVVLSRINIQFDDGMILETEIDEKFKIQSKYEDAIAEGKTAVTGGYVTSKSRDLVRIMIGNFPPNSKALLRVFFYS